MTTGVASGARGATQTFHKFVEGQDNAAASAAGARSGHVEPERKDFWDSFGGGASAATEKPVKPSSIGTSAVKKTGNTGAAKKKDDGWGDDW